MNKIIFNRNYIYRKSFKIKIKDFKQFRFRSNLNLLIGLEGPLDGDRVKVRMRGPLQYSARAVSQIL